MRTPMENGFGSIGTPCACSASKVSRALCPMASSTQEAGMTASSPPCAARTPVTQPSSVTSPVTFTPKQTSPP